jgi:selenocysteine lyase/cysteine desulfurase
LDGGIHGSRRAKWADGIRHRQIEEAGIKILRFRNERIAKELAAVLQEIAAVCNERRSQPPARAVGVEPRRGAEVPWRQACFLRPGDWVVKNEHTHVARIAFIESTVTNETVYSLTVEEDHSLITKAGVAHNSQVNYTSALTVSELLSNEPLRLHEFPVAREKVFLAHAGDCPLPRRVAEAISQYTQLSTTGDQEAAVFPGILTQGRAMASRLLNCDPEEVAFVGPTSLALSFIASGLKFTRGDNVLIYFDDYPANVYPWLALAEQGVEVRRINTPDLGIIRTSDVLNLVDENTRLVSLASCHFISGERIDVPAIGRALRDRGILFCLDAIQTLGAFPTPVEHVDFLAADAHKWLLGPCGSGLLYVRRSLQERVSPPVYGWHNVRSPNFVAQDRIVFRSGAKKYEAGTHNLLGLVGLIAALEMILELGVAEIAKELLRKRALLVPGLQNRGYRVLRAEAAPETASAIVSFYRADTDLAALHQRLLATGIVTSLRTDRAGQKYIRLSPHVYNSDAELEQLLGAL